MGASVNSVVADEGSGGSPLEGAIRRSVAHHWAAYQAATAMARRSNHPDADEDPRKTFTLYCWALYRASEYAASGRDVGEAPWPSGEPH
jgi:hypothetical protein